MIGRSEINVRLKNLIPLVLLFSLLVFQVHGSLGADVCPVDGKAYVKALGIRRKRHRKRSSRSSWPLFRVGMRSIKNGCMAALSGGRENRVIRGFWRRPFSIGRPTFNTTNPIWKVIRSPTSSRKASG